MNWIALLLLGFGVPGFLAGFVLLTNGWSELQPGLLLVFAVMGFVVGSLVGQEPNRTWQGAWTGLMPGPFGWIIVRLLSTREADDS